MHNKKMTLKMFRKQKKYMCKKMNISSEVYDKYTEMILKYMGYCDPDKTYCGRGDFGDKVTPDLWFRKPGYQHDGLVSAIEHGELGFTKHNVDLWFKWAMFYICGWKIWRKPFAILYYEAVDKLGDYEVKHESSN